MTDRITQLLESSTTSAADLQIEAVEDWLVAKIVDDRDLAFSARERFADTLRDTMGVAEIIGARRVLQKASAVLARGIEFTRHGESLLAFAKGPVLFKQGVIPNVVFEDALFDLMNRTPVTIRSAAERTGQAIAQLYGSGRVIAFSGSAEAAVTRRAQQYLEQAFVDGLGESEAARGLRMTVDEVRTSTKAWSQAYARNVFRTNLSTAVNAGRFRQLQDPDVSAVVPALRFETAGDVDVRPNHKAADGMVLRKDHPAWARLAPPLGYQCRCQVVELSVLDLEDEGRLDANGDVRDSTVPAEAKPDEGFRHGGRPDIAGLSSL